MAFDNGLTKERFGDAERLVRENLKVEIEAKEAVTKQVDALKDIVDLSLAALQDHQPSLSAMLMAKAKKIFG